MLENYSKTALRNLLQRKVYLFINIAGLSVGLSCAMLIILYVQDEMSYDRFHNNVAQIYRIDKRQIGEDGSVHNGSYTGYFPGPRFAEKVPEILGFVRFEPGQADVKTSSGIASQAVSFADPNFFSVFSFPLLSGSAGSVLAQQDAVVITEETAKKYFGGVNAIGKIISIKADSVFKPYVVTGVAKDCPQNSSIKFQVILPLRVAAEEESKNSNWFNSFLSTFVVLAPGADIKMVQDKMARVFEADAREAISEIKSKYGVKDIRMSYTLEPLTAIHLGKMVPGEDEILADKSNPGSSYILSAISLFMLLIACINFINLTIARSVKRAKEIGVRKAVGGTRRQLAVQFLGESFMLCFIAFGLAFFITMAVLPVFNQLSGKALSVSYLFSVKPVACYTVLFVFTSLLAGVYPALVLSGYSPVQTLYGRFHIAGKNYLQKALVIFQFALASFLITGAVTIYLQVNYLTTQSIGYDDSNLITIGKYPLTRTEAALFRQELMNTPGVTGVASKNAGDNGNTVKVRGGRLVNVSVETIDTYYLPLLKVPVIAGRNFSATYPADSAHSVLVNESFVRKAGWKEPVGEQITSFDGESYTVIGVVKDYHYKPLTERIEPQLFTMNTANSYGMMYIKIKPGTQTQSLQYISRVFKELFPLSTFIYNFKREQNRHSYAAEARWREIILYSALLTVFISCIGLFGLSVLSAERRAKEIGIRKVLGASVGGIVSTLSQDFIKLILIALAIAMPFAWFATHKWLQGYPYRISLSWWLFAAAAALVLGVALITTGFQSVKAAMTNPVQRLRME